MNEQHAAHGQSSDRQGAPGRRRRAPTVPTPLWPSPEAAAVQRQLELAADALLSGLTREGVITALIGRITRDEHYLAYRRACRRRTNYDSQVEADLRALALAVTWLDEECPARQ